MKSGLNGQDNIICVNQFTQISKTYILNASKVRHFYTFLSKSAEESIYVFIDVSEMEGNKICFVVEINDIFFVTR